MYIGKRIRELRKLQEMTLSHLAEKSGVQIATLSRIEHLKMTGTLDSHIDIARALGVDLTQLYTDIVRREDKVSLKTSKTATDVFVHSDKSSYEILTPKILTKKMMPILLKIDPEGKTNTEQNRVTTEKFIFVLEGKVEAVIGDQSYALSKHSTLYFDASVDHYFINKGKSVAKVICVATPVAL